MTIRPHAVRIRALLAFALATAAAPLGIAKAAEDPGTPHTIKVAAAEPIEEGAAGDRQSTFTLVHQEDGTCFAIAPPGGEGLVAGDSYVVVTSNSVDDALKHKLAADHPKCAIVDVVARAVH